MPDPKHISELIPGAIQQLASEQVSEEERRKKQREAAVLVRHRGLTQEEAAQEMGVNKNTVGKLIEAYDNRNG